MIRELNHGEYLQVKSSQFVCYNYSYGELYSFVHLFLGDKVNVTDIALFIREGAEDTPGEYKYFRVDNDLREMPLQILADLIDDHLNLPEVTKILREGDWKLEN